MGRGPRSCGPSPPPLGVGHWEARSAWAALTTFIAKGTIEGYDTYHVRVPLEIYTKAPNRRKMIYRTQNGDSTSVFDRQRGFSIDASVNWRNYDETR